ncbi:MULTISPECIES: hypothetical protein [Aeromicrobium]|uniref:hypothetical protein n=1 Tax=Aeromicrobium TaxID=2040 RepID=UPI0025805615|nr:MULTISPECIES: hypothetical protein [Aeromicrobium]
MEHSQELFVVQAEQRAAWNLETASESAHPSLVEGDYLHRLQAARDRIRDRDE